MANPDEVLALLAERIARVMAVDVGTVTGESRFDEDLHADSLDLLEVVEGVESDLRQRGERVALPDDELLGLRAVGQASERIASATSAAGEAEAR